MRAVMVLIVLFLALPLTGLRAQQQPGVVSLPVLTADTPKQCCRVCRKGKPCGNGCISQERRCTKEPGCACNVSDAG